MARRFNELFIGKEFLNIEGREIKHPALIKLYASLNLNKISDDKIELMGLDLETNHKTGELKLLGFYNGDTYKYYYNTNFIEVLFNMVSYCDRNNLSLVYWNRLDPFVIYKQFLNYINDEELIKLSMIMFNKVSGEFDKYENEWTLPPIAIIDFNGYEFGIKNVIRSSIQFFIRKHGSNTVRTIWAYDIAQLYQADIETEAKRHTDYYSKIDESVHLVDWERFDNDLIYRDLVLKSNELDSRAVYDLGYVIQEMFKKAFNYYTRNLISQGAIARSAIIAVLKEYHEGDETKLLEDVKAIGFMHYYDDWLEKYGEEVLKDLYALTMEAYSGGQIEAYMYGYAETGFTADLANAYPAIIQQLWDLRGAKIRTGKGKPPKVKNAYTFIRGEVNIPASVDYHPLTIKHPIHNSTNIRAVGSYKASYILEEREFLEKQGATFTDESYYIIETTGKLSPLSIVSKTFDDLRAKLTALNDSAWYVAKTSNASLYGIQFEAVHTHELIDNEIVKTGYRAGEFFNPIFASYITALTRIKIADACTAIKQAGGKPILVMTDSVFWEGNKDMLPKHMYRDKKTTGYFEAPETIHNIVCLGSGRYSYEKIDDAGNRVKLVAKKRGLNATSIEVDEDTVIKNFSWLDALKIATEQNSIDIKVNVRALVSVGMVLGNHDYTYKDLGLIVDAERTIPLIVGATKRDYDESKLSNAYYLSHRLLETKPLILTKGMMGDGLLLDATLKTLREKMMVLHCSSTKEKRKKSVKKAVKKYHNQNKDEIRNFRKENYKQLRAYGYRADEASKMQGWSLEKIQLQLMKDGKL